MTREEAIFAMEYYKLHFATEKGAEAFDMAIKALSSSEIPNKWIPVESALPEVVVGEHDIRCSEDVLVYDGDDLRVGYFVRIEKLDRGYWNIYGDDCFEPIAWTQLPQPYKAESEVQE